MEEPKLRLLLKSSLRKKILPSEALDNLKSFAEVEVNPHDRDLTEDEAVASFSTIPS